jgi:hypothetical protein
MAIPPALPVTKRKRGNHNWGCPIPSAPALPTEFELRIEQLQLTARMYTSSRELRAWCEQNRNRCYIPEWLLEEWRITVDPTFSAVARPNRAESATQPHVESAPARDLQSNYYPSQSRGGPHASLRVLLPRL